MSCDIKLLRTYLDHPMKRQRVIKQVCLLDVVFITIQAYEVTASGILPCATVPLGKILKQTGVVTV